MAPAPFIINEASPANTDPVANYPADERANRAVIEDALAVEHDLKTAGSTAHHKFGRGTTAARDATTDWVVGSVWINTDTSPSAWQAVKSVGPVVWETLTAQPTDDNVLLTQALFLGVW